MHLRVGAGEDKKADRQDEHDNPKNEHDPLERSSARGSFKTAVRSYICHTINITDKRGKSLTAFGIYKGAVGGACLQDIRKTPHMALAVRNHPLYAEV